MNSGWDSGALFDSTGTYRYRLWREWDAGLPRVCFVMLNPSTADAERDDPTIRRCTGFARQWGYGSLEVVNLFAFRATHPADLRRAPDPIGPENDSCLVQATRDAARTIAAWGCHGTFRGRSEIVAGLLPDDTHCFGRTQTGQPLHPLYQRGDTRTIPFREGVLEGDPRRCARF